MCKLCNGFGSLFCIQNNSKVWWDCPQCCGHGVISLFSCGEIKMPKIKSRKPNKNENHSK